MISKAKFASDRCLSRRVALGLLGGGLTVAPVVASANAGLPMLALMWPLQWIGLLPIIVLESAITARVLKQPFKQLWWPVSKANLWSTAVGLPLAWAAMMLLELLIGAGVFAVLPNALTNQPWLEYLTFPLMSAWIVGSSRLELASAFVVLAVVFCAVSIFIERRVLARSLAALPVVQVNRSMCIANIASYLMLTLFTGLFLLKG